MVMVMGFVGTFELCPLRFLTLRRPLESSSVLRKRHTFDFSPDTAAITTTLPKGKSDDEWSSSLYIVKVEGTESAE